ncbi:MAG: hypothetical protein IPJ03_11945 [Ignavibacteriales bacterium]|nr:hypothetical protein [Ignavibacteriales bacterium]
MLYFVFVYILSLLQYEDYVATTKISRIFFHYFAFFSYLFVIFRIESKRLIRLFDIIEKLTLILTLFFILDSGFGLPIFAATDQFNVYAGDLVERNLATFPLFSFFILARLGMKKEMGVYSIIGILGILFSVFLLITRSLAVAAIIIMMAGFFFRDKVIIKSGNISRLIGRLLLITLLFIILLVTLFQSQIKYFAVKVEDVTSANSTEAIVEGTSLYNRYLIIESRIKKVWEVNPFTGLGMLHPDDARKVFYPDLFIRKQDKTGSVIIGDQSWGSFIGSVGFVGVFLYLLLFGYPIFYIWRQKIFYKLHIDFYAIFLATAMEVGMRSFFSRNLFVSFDLLVFYFVLIVYFIELYYNKDELSDSSIKSITSN